MKAFAAAYPDAITRVELRKARQDGAPGDWAVLLRGTWFYYADGRLLSEELLPNAEEYSRQSFYSYPADLPPWKEPEGEMAERLSKVLENRKQNPPKRSPLFFDTLYEARNRDESYSNLVQIGFLGKSIPVHKLIAGPLAKVEARIREEAKRDPEVQTWINGIGSLGAWNWRNVAVTQSRSYHAYAVALDIQPKALRGLATYWLWTADNNAKWYNVPYSKRYHPPVSVVKAFEAYGFCWGGKWPLFDTMHFEYRPEIMILYGLPVEK
jgi:hypothetical protein